MDVAKKKLLLVTAGYPYGQSERGFLTAEFAELSQRFDVSILAIGSREPMLYPLDEAVSAQRFFYSPIKSVPGICRTLGSLFTPAVWHDWRSAVKGQNFSSALRRMKQTVAYRVNMLDVKEAIRKIVEEKQIDMIYSYWCTEATWAAVELKKRYPKLKVITRLHRIDLYNECRDTGRLPFRPRIAAGIDMLCFISQVGRNYFLDTWGREFRDKAKVFYLGSAAQEPVVKQPDGPMQIISCSLVIPRKRIERIIRALALLPKEMKVHWTLFGDGPQREELEELAKALLSQSSNVTCTFRGFVKNKELPDAYRAVGADVFVTTSASEGLPVTLMEAFSMGIPAIATAVDGIPEMVKDGKTGFLLSSDAQPEEVARAIEKYAAQTQQQREQMSRQALELWQGDFDAQRNAVRFVSCLEALLENGV